MNFKSLATVLKSRTRKSVFMSLQCSTRQSLLNFCKKIIGSSPIMTNFVLKFQKLISVNAVRRFTKTKARLKKRASS